MSVSQQNPSLNHTFDFGKNCVGIDQNMNNFSYGMPLLSIPQMSSQFSPTQTPLLPQVPLVTSVTPTFNLQRSKSPMNPMPNLNYVYGNVNPQFLMAPGLPLIQTPIQTQAPSYSNGWSNSQEAQENGCDFSQFQIFPVSLPNVSLELAPSYSNEWSNSLELAPSYSNEWSTSQEAQQEQEVASEHVSDTESIRSRSISNTDFCSLQFSRLKPYYGRNVWAKLALELNNLNALHEDDMKSNLLVQWAEKALTERNQRVHTYRAEMDLCCYQLTGNGFANVQNCYINRDEHFQVTSRMTTTQGRMGFVPAKNSWVLVESASEIAHPQLKREFASQLLGQQYLEQSERLESFGAAYNVRVHYQGCDGSVLRLKRDEIRLAPQIITYLFKNFGFDLSEVSICPTAKNLSSGKARKKKTYQNSNGLYYIFQASFYFHAEDPQKQAYIVKEMNKYLQTIRGVEGKLFTSRFEQRPQKNWHKYYEFYMALEHGFNNVSYAPQRFERMHKYYVPCSVQSLEDFQKVMEIIQDHAPDHVYYRQCCDGQQRLTPTAMCIFLKYDDKKRYHAAFDSINSANKQVPNFKTFDKERQKVFLTQLHLESIPQFQMVSELAEFCGKGGVKFLENQPMHGYQGEMIFSFKCDGSVSLNQVRQLIQSNQLSNAVSLSYKLNPKPDFTESVVEIFAEFSNEPDQNVWEASLLLPLDHFFFEGSSM